MPKVKVKFHDGSRLNASFEGFVDPDGPEGYVLSGTIKVICLLDRSSTNFKNTVALGHGGTSAEYTYVEREIDGHEENVFTIEGRKARGVRLKNETVDLRIGINTGLSGQFHYGDKATAQLGGPPQEVTTSFAPGEATGMAVRFEGTAWADGPTGYVIRGRLNTTTKFVSNFAQRATFGHKASTGTWQYETADIPHSPEFTVRGDRMKDEDIKVVLGLTSGTFGAWKYGDEASYSLPLQF
ncbi:hypothetical protein [Kitasatospora sp. NPDC098663]|uniref:hypothetical protein n=1 Tax=Kitasatospora sp. NPDC098663 TaxID=3364096 RepID=UPI003806ED36